MTFGQPTADSLRADREWRQRAAARYAEKHRSEQPPRASQLRTLKEQRKRQRTDPQRPARPNDFTPEVRDIIAARSGGRCEVAWRKCAGRATQVHHRKLRRHRDHRVVNGLHVCDSCHRKIHNGAPVEDGLIVLSSLDPAVTVARLRYGLVLLHDDGTYTRLAENNGGRVSALPRVGTQEDKTEGAKT